KKWLPLAIDSTKHLKPVEKLRVVEKLKELKDRASVKSGRPYDNELGSWLQNALTQHRINPFHAIIGTDNPGGDDVVLRADDVDEHHALMTVPHECAVPRNVESLSAALSELLRLGSRIVFVEPFFDPYNRRHKQIFFRLLSIVQDLNPNTVCEIHYRYHENKPANADLERQARALFEHIIPQGMTLDVFCWREKDGGEDFHARYLLTDKGGIRIDAGFDPVGEHQKTDMSLMDFGLSQMRLTCISRNATTYELVEPVLRIDSNGTVQHL
ncbi:MAG: hypothetical protein AB2805_06995, partial [Candidatus Thiodiazotropha sp.]